MLNEKERNSELRRLKCDAFHREFRDWVAEWTFTTFTINVLTCNASVRKGSVCCKTRYISIKSEQTQHIGSRQCTYGSLRQNGRCIYLLLFTRSMLIRGPGPDQLTARNTSSLANKLPVDRRRSHQYRTSTSFLPCLTSRAAVSVIRRVWMQFG